MISIIIRQFSTKIFLINYILKNRNLRENWNTNFSLKRYKCTSFHVWHKKSRQIVFYLKKKKIDNCGEITDSLKNETNIYETGEGAKKRKHLQVVELFQPRCIQVSFRKFLSRDNPLVVPSVPPMEDRGNS